MGKVIVRPLQKFEVDKFIKDETGTKTRVRDAKSKTNAALPSLIVAYKEDDPSQFVTWGLRSRRTSHVVEITWWSGDNIELSIEALKGCIYTAILEGRKRVECLDEVHKGKHIDGSLVTPNTTTPLGSLFVHEGFHPFYTGELVDVEIYGHVWDSDGIPTPNPDTEVTLYVNEAVDFYRNKNEELYAKDRDLYREDAEGKTFKTRIEEAVATVRSISNINVIDQPEWHGNEQKSK